MGFIIIYPTHSGLVSVNRTDNRRFYSLLNHHQLEIRQMSMWHLTFKPQHIPFCNVSSVKMRPVHRDSCQPLGTPSAALWNQGTWRYNQTWVSIRGSFCSGSPAFCSFLIGLNVVSKIIISLWESFHPRLPSCGCFSGTLWLGMSQSLRTWGGFMSFCLADSYKHAYDLLNALRWGQGSHRVPQQSLPSPCKAVLDSCYCLCSVQWK